MTPTRRQWLRTAAMLAPGLFLRAARKEFWETKDPANWSAEEKQILLGQSPWAQQGVVRMGAEKRGAKSQGYGSNGKLGNDMPDTRPGVPAGGMRSVPIGDPVPRPPNPDPGHPVQFPVLARWETARPVRMAGSPEFPEVAGQFYVIRLRGLPLMPPPKTKPGEAAANPNEGMLQLLREGSVLERKDKAGLPCARLFNGTGAEAMEALLFFPRGADPITAGDKVVTLACNFAPFQLAIKFPLKDMMFQGELAL